MARAANANRPSIPPSPQDGASRPQRGEALRIIVADDDRDAVSMLSWLLVQEGFQVREVYRGDAVQAQVREFSPDALLLDIGMPGMTGYDVARRLSAEYGERCPVLIAVTGWDKSADRLLGQTAGFTHYVTKPYDPNYVISLLKQVSRRT